MKGYTEHEIIQGIKTDNSRIIRFIYNNYYNSIKMLVRSFNNSKLEPDNVFQEGLTRAILSVRSETFKSKSLFSTFLYGICKNVCRKEINRDKKFISLDRDTEQYHDDTDYEILNLILELKNKMDPECRTIFDLRFGFEEHRNNRDLDDKINKTKHKTIATVLGISEANARQKLKRCLEKLWDLVKGNPDLKILYDL